MTAETDKPTVAIYLRYFLSPSETFVYRQLLGVRRLYNPIVLTANPSNLDLFPFEPVYVHGKRFFGKVYTRLLRVVTGRYAALTPGQSRYWRRVLKEQRVRLIHAHFGHFAMDLLTTAKSLKIPMVVTFHGFDASVLLANRGYLRALPELVDYAHVITISRNMVDRLAAAGIRLSKAHVHYIGVPIEHFRYVERKSIGEKLRENSPLTFLQVSNFIEVKGHRYTLEAFARFVAKHSNATLTLAGDGPLRAEMQAMSKKLGIEKHVRFPGRITQDRVIDLMHQSDVLLQHSVSLPDGRKEGLPTVIMEGMATGLVVISTAHSGIPELIEDGVDGLLIRERDVDQYAATLEGLADAHPEMGRRARQKIEKQFNMSVQNEELMKIYEGAINETTL